MGKRIGKEILKVFKGDIVSDGANLQSDKSTTDNEYLIVGSLMVIHGMDMQTVGNFINTMTRDL